MPSKKDNIQLSSTMNREAPMPLFCDFVYERYLPFAQTSKRSWKMEKNNLERHVLPYLGSYRLSDITADILLKWTDTLQLTGLAYTSTYRMFWLAKYVLNCSVRWGVLATDAAFKAANLCAKPSRTPILLDSSEVVRLIGILKTYQHRASANAIHLMLLTGATKSEILNAQWQDVDFKQGVLATRQTFTGRPHLIPLNNEALKLIHSLPRIDDVPWLFFTRNGTRLQTVTHDWYDIRKILGREDLRLQDLRHSFANFLVNIGINQKDLRTILGHYKPETLELVRNNSFGK